MNQKMEPQPKEIWTTALRGGEYEQARGSFIEIAPDTGKVTHCCLAVLTHEAAKAGIAGLRWPENNEPMVVCRWDAEDQEWRQPRDPQEAQDWMENLPELDDERDAMKAEGWAWRRIEAMTEGDLPQVVVGWSGLESTNPDLGGHDAIHWNDGEEASFVKIADLIEQYR